MADNFEARRRFILDQHAKFVVGMRRLKKRQARTQREIDKLIEVTTPLAQRCRKINRRRQVPRKHLLKADRHSRELGQETDRRLDALIDTVEKLARRNGP